MSHVSVVISHTCSKCKSWTELCTSIIWTYSWWRWVKLTPLKIYIVMSHTCSKCKSWTELCTSIILTYSWWRWSWLLWKYILLLFHTPVANVNPELSTSIIWTYSWWRWSWLLWKYILLLCHTPVTNVNPGLSCVPVSIWSIVGGGEVDSSENIYCCCFTHQ